MLVEHVTLSAGTIIRGRYIVRSLLSKEGFSVTYLVEDQHRKGSLYALKEVFLQGKRELSQFILAYQPLVRLEHPGLTRVYALFKDDKRNCAYLLMAYIEGSNLETLRQRQPEQRFSWLQVMNIIPPIISALSYMHSQQPPIVHGEIKPANIILPKAGGGVVLVGIGSPWRCGSDSTTTSDGSYSSSYRAPEQYASDLDVYADIYGLGATVYTLAAGIVPPDASSRLRHLDNQGSDPLRPISEMVPHVPIRIARAIDRAMSLDVHDCFSSVEQFWEALWSLVENPPVTASRLSGPSRAPKQAVTRPATVSVPKQRRVSRTWRFWPFAPKQVVTRPATVSVPKQRHTPRVTEQTVTGPATVSNLTPPYIPPLEPAQVGRAVEASPPTSELTVDEQGVRESGLEAVAEPSPEVLPWERTRFEPEVEEPVATFEPAVTDDAIDESMLEITVERPLLVLPSEPGAPELWIEEPASLPLKDQPIQPLKPLVVDDGAEQMVQAEQVIKEPVLASDTALSEQVIEEPASIVETESPETESRVLPLDSALPEHVNEESVPTAEVDQPSEEPAPESVTGEPSTSPLPLDPASASSPYYGSPRPSVTSVQMNTDLKQRRTSRTRKFPVLLIVLVLLIGLGVSADSLAHVLVHPAASVNSRPATSSSGPTSRPVSTILGRTYKGTIFDLPANVKTSLTFTNVKENQGKISGFLTVGPGLLGYGSFSGTINLTTKHLQFTVTDSARSPTLFFEGAVQSATSLSGDFYRCNSAQGSTCVKGTAGYGVWDVVLVGA